MLSTPFYILDGVAYHYLYAKNSLNFNRTSPSVYRTGFEQFVSLTLCSDRLLIELAEPSQIAAQSPYSKNPLMMLDKINTDKPVLEPQLTELLPYLDKTILINETFYPQLVSELKNSV